VFLTTRFLEINCTIFFFSDKICLGSSAGEVSEYQIDLHKIPRYLRSALHDVKVGEWCAMSATKIIIDFILFLQNTINCPVVCYLCSDDNF